MPTKPRRDSSGGFVKGGIMHAVLSRRDVLSKCFAAGLLVAIPPLSQATMLAMWEQAESRRLKPTPPNDLGPFYKPKRLSHIGSADPAIRVCRCLYPVRYSM